MHPLPKKKKRGNARKIAHTHPSAQIQRSEGGNKLMWNASSEEQRALKHVARCVKITVDLTREEQPVLCSK